MPLASKSRRRWNRWANNAGPAGSVHRRSRTRKRSIGPTPCHPRIPWVMSRTDPPTRSYPPLFHEVPVAFGTIRCRNPCATKLKVSEGLIHNLELLIDKSLFFSLSLLIYFLFWFVCLRSKAKHRAVALWTINTVTNFGDCWTWKCILFQHLVMEENSCYDLFTRADIIEKYCLYENLFAIEMVSCSYIPFQIFVFFFLLFSRNYYSWTFTLHT